MTASTDTRFFTTKAFEEVTQLTVRRLFQLSETKGKEYSGPLDRLANFRRYAESLGLDYRMVLAVYAGKHWDAIVSYCKTGKVFSSESIDGRIDDLIVYLLLLKCMVIESEPLQALKPSSSSLKSTSQPQLGDFPNESRN